METLRDADRKESEGIQLIVDAASVSLTGASDLLDRAALLFRENCAPSTRERNFRQWVANLSNLGCALTLLGKSNTRMGGAALLEEAMDAFGALLNEPALREMDGQYASVHVNLAHTFQVVAELALPAERVGYLERAIHSLTAALEAVAPAQFRSLLKSAHMPAGW
jgi:hypothetical protein